MQVIARPAAPDEAEKQMQKAIPKRAVDYCGPFLKLLRARLAARCPWEPPAMQPTMASGLDLLPPEGYPSEPASSLAPKFVHNSQNRVRCSINALAWQPDGRRVITGAQTGEITLWRGQDYSFESVLQAHEAPLRAMTYTRNGGYLLMGDDAGTLKIFKRNLQIAAHRESPLREIAAHRESVRAVSVGPTDLKFCTCSDDSTIKARRVWDMYSCEVESTLTGHGGDVRHCQWHPTSSLLASASKDALVKLWDARTAGGALGTLHGHKGAVMQALWNQNGNWLLSVSRDQTLKVWDVRMLRELHTLQGHSRDVLCADWHPVHEQVCVSGAFDGALCHWVVGQAEPQAVVQGGHDSSVWALGYHPLGHVLASAGGDAAVKFWCRQRPGDPWQDTKLKEQQEGATSYAAAASEAPGLRPAPLPAGGAAAPGLGGGAGPRGIPGLGALGDASMPLPGLVTAAGRAQPPGLVSSRSLPGRAAARPAGGPPPCRGAGPGPAGGRGGPGPPPHGFGGGGPGPGGFAPPPPHHQQQQHHPGGGGMMGLGPPGLPGPPGMGGPGPGPGPGHHGGFGGPPPGAHFGGPPPGLPGPPGMPGPPPGPGHGGPMFGGPPPGPHGGPPGPFRNGGRGGWPGGRGGGRGPRGRGRF
ncbi:MAG: WD40-repeat-containing domain protein [Monoraphidium minutum]|nr:MAG: WD40-repeat-containing domain protein [Monoraphidium minutum]